MGKACLLDSKSNCSVKPISKSWLLYDHFLNTPTPYLAIHPALALIHCEGGLAGVSGLAPISTIGPLAPGWNRASTSTAATCTHHASHVAGRKHVRQQAWARNQILGFRDFCSQHLSGSEEWLTGSRLMAVAASLRLANRGSSSLNIRLSSLLGGSFFSPLGLEVGPPSAELAVWDTTLSAYFEATARKLNGSDVDDDNH